MTESQSSSEDQFELAQEALIEVLFSLQRAHLLLGAAVMPNSGALYHQQSMGSHAMQLQQTKVIFEMIAQLHFGVSKKLIEDLATVAEDHLRELYKIRIGVET